MIYKTIILISFCFLFKLGVTAQIDFTEHLLDNNFSGISGLFIADINNDGKNDIIGCGFGADDVVWWENNGGAPDTWNKYYVDNNFDRAMYVFVDDVNNDNLKDIIVSGQNEVVVYLNDGNNESWPKTQVVTGFNNSHGVYAGDVDNDGDIDIAATSCEFGRVSWFENINEQGNGSEWEEHVVTDIFGCTQTVCLEDIDGDGNLDVIAGGDNKVIWWKSDGGDPINWTMETINDDFYVSHWVDAVDINNDGEIDILGAAVGDNEIAWWENSGGDDITWVKHVVTNSFRGALTAYSADIDNDGDKDFIGTAGQDQQVAWFENTGDDISFTKHSLKYGVSGAWPIFTGDIDDDNDFDIIAGSNNYGNVFLFENKPATTAIIKNNIQDINNFNVYPNPSRSDCNINYRVESKSNVLLQIFDSKGCLIKTLTNKNQAKGVYEIKWNCKNAENSQVTTGIYMCKLVIGNNISSRKLIVK